MLFRIVQVEMKDMGQLVTDLESMGYLVMIDGYDIEIYLPKEENNDN